MIPKTFLQALEHFSSNNRKARTFLTDKRLSHDERKILQGFFLLRSSKTQEVLSVANTIVENTIYVTALKNLLLGSAYNNQSSFELAKTHYKRAQEALRNLDLPDLYFVCMINSFILAYNQKEAEELDALIGDILSLKTKTPIQKFRVQRCHFMFMTFMNKDKEAGQVLNKMHAMKDEALNADRAIFRTDEFNYHLKQGRYESCYEVLGQMKADKIFYHSANYNFMKTLLDHLTLDKPIYYNLNDIKPYALLYWQLKLIKDLEERDELEAKKDWDQLKILIPESCGEPFQYLGTDTSLFSLCLMKYANAFALRPVPKTEGVDLVSERIIAALQEQSLKKEVLFERVFGGPLQSKDDLKRLSKNIYKLNKKGKVQIVYQKGCYKIAS